MNIKRLTAVLLSVLLLAGMVSVCATAAERTQFGMINELELSDNPDFISSHRDVIEKIYTGYMNHDESINIYDYKVPTSELKSLFSATIGVYPEIFFVDHSISYSRIGDIVYELSPTYTYTAAQVSEMLGEFYAKADEYLAKVDDSMDDFTKAVILHDQLAINNSYSIWSEDGTVYSNNYTFMVEGWGRCENYAECYAYLLAQVGIKSEIINSDSMVHEWMKIKLDGSEYYYNVDLTFDDPLVNDSDRPGKVDHTYFLLSDEEFQTVDSELGRSQQHYDYAYINESDDAYDDYDNLHTLENPMFYIGGELYTLYQSGNKGYIASYYHADDSFDNKVEITDIWHAGGNSYWIGNFSGVAEYDGLLYYNGENCVYVYDPETGESGIYLENILDDGNQLYGLYEKDGVLVCLAAPNPNTTKTEVELGKLEKYYRIRFDAGEGSGTMQTIRTTETSVALPEMSFTAPEGKVFAGWLDEDGNAVDGTMILDPDVYEYKLTANWLGVYGIAVSDSDYGTVSVKENTALEGSDVEINVEPDRNCRLVSLTVTDNNGEQIAVENNIFTMPASDVTVTAVFERISYPVDTDGNVVVYYTVDNERVTAERAFPDTELSLELSGTAQPEEGSYFTGEYTLDGAGLGYESDGGVIHYVSGFTMPAHNVEIAAVQARQETLNIDFTSVSTIEIDRQTFSQLSRDYGTIVDGDMLLDLNGSGTPDVRLVTVTEGDDSEVNYYAQKLNTADAGGKLDLTFSEITDRYSAIGFVIPVLGDVDFDGEITVNDVTLLQRSLLGINSEDSGEITAVGDVNGDGRLSVRDVTLIQMYIARIEIPFSAGTVV